MGYTWVSTGEQTLDLQLGALKAAGCGRVFEETASGAEAARPVLADAVSADALSSVSAGDTLVVWRLDRLGRSLGHLTETAALLAGRGIGFESRTEQIDTTTPGGKPVFRVFEALAAFERDLVRDRTRAGLAPASPGTTGGTRTSPPSVPRPPPPGPPATARSRRAPASGGATRLRPGRGRR